jgi:biofilm PGA synthesis N-glycosyltransferase PgaC
MIETSDADSEYVLISPCRNEQDYMVTTLESIVAQTHKPSLWVIVDDGSTDNTANILREYQQKYSFINILTLEDRGSRMVGPGVVNAFNSGFKLIDHEAYSYIGKLDLDLDVPPKYFETLIGRMKQDPRLGNCSGKPYFYKKDRLFSERRGDELSVGMIKFLRMSCFLQIEGFISQVMWDAIDCHKARYLGWKVRSWDIEPLRFIHLRQMGSSQSGILTGKMRHGFGQYFMGTGLFYMAASSIFRSIEKPYILGAMAMYWGYLKSYLKEEEKLADKELINFIRNFQRASLFKGKSMAIAKFESHYEHKWNPIRHIRSSVRS